MDRLEKIDLRLFEPKGNHLATQYEELGGFEELKDLSESEILFCWYLGNPTSPFNEVEDENEKLELCYNETLETVKVPEDEKNEILRGDMPDKFQNGINIMRNFSVSQRLRSYMMTKHIINNLQKIAYLNAGDFDDMDEDAAKKYVDTSIKIAKEMPGMIKALESGYGLSVKVQKKANEVQISMSDLNK